MTTQIDFENFADLKAALVKSAAWPTDRIAKLEVAISARRAAYPEINDDCKIGTTVEQINGQTPVVLAHSKAGGMIDMMTARHPNDKTRSDYI